MNTISDEHRAKMLAAAKAWRESPAYVPPMLGKPHPMKGKKQNLSEETRRRMSESAKRRGSNRTGKKHTPETRKKISKVVRERTPRGPACHSFIDGKCGDRHGERLTTAYKRWRFDVYSRDGFACQLCGDDRGGNLNAHHIYPFAKYPALRLNLDNGITICETCHDRLHYGTIRKKRGGRSRSGKHVTG